MSAVLLNVKVMCLLRINDFFGKFRPILVTFMVHPLIHIQSAVGLDHDKKMQLSV